MTSDDIKKIREMMEFLVKIEIHKELESLSDKEKKVYELIGKKNQSQMANQINASTGGVSGILQKLEKKGFLIKDGKSYRKVI